MPSIPYLESVTVIDPGKGSPPPGRVRSTAALLRSTPRYFQLTFHADLVAQLQSLVASRQIDAVIAYELSAGDHVAALKVPGVVKILDGCEPFMFRGERASVRGTARMWKFKRFLKQMLERFDAYIAVSDAELAWIRSEINPDRGWGCVIPNGTDLAPPYGGPVDLDRVIYTGSLTYRANLNAVDFFTTRVWPTIRAHRPTARFVITGQLPDAATTQRLHAIPGVVVAGLRPDYREFVASSGALAVTLQEGGGTRIKILEALALGCPVIATTRAVEGITLDPGREVIIADQPAAIAAAVLRVLEDPLLRNALVENGRAAATRYSWQNSQRLLIDVVQSAIQQRAFLQPA